MSDRDGFAEQLDDLLVPWPFEEIANFLDAGDGVVVDDHPECAGVVKIDDRKTDEKRHLSRLSSWY